MLKKYEKAGELVSIKGMLKAREAISHYVRPTNLVYYSEISRLVGCDAFVKHENHMPTGSFKIRGAINFFHTIPKQNVENGVLVSTRGNHGLAMAWAARWFNVPCTVVVPENNNPETNRIIEGFGAELIVHGQDFYDAQSFCDELVASAGYYYVEQGNEPEMLNGVGTMGLEIFEDLSDVDVIICPIGGGAGCASLLRLAQAVNPAVEIIGVQAERAAAFYQSLQQGDWVVIDQADTIADGLAARSVFQLPYTIMKDHIKDVVLLSEEEILQGISLALETTHNLAEGAGAAPIMAALKRRDRLQGKKVVLIMTGGNLDRVHLEQALRYSSPLMSSKDLK
ncbi:MAG: L-threonine dehydratase catabolic TdcB [Deltaproteobacteria bacterium ADurb.BinA179]|jgi:threonine dehydratase|nr:threonine/serine dehydratase [Deltaproteobacteria bacterium]MDI9543229.1 threonine/serine dehydratase [Pseudomonadota bacterium]NLW69082.1 threonine/serine dehydratase [Bacteriovoracaceae bacterium]OPZ28635.1 MAG: L-threonine dehydratase catabolic TdcB [Deltaproteobacteria bacterium ADurb.BinA179]HRR20889.1 threonine/serine dehydratase [Desulfomonilia bacterium]